MKKPHQNAIRFKMRKIVDMKRLSWNLTGMKRAQTDTKSIQKIPMKKKKKSFEAAIRAPLCFYDVYVIYFIFPLRGKHVCFPAEFYPYAMHSVRPSAYIFIAIETKTILVWIYSATMEGPMWVRIWWKGNENRSYSSLNRRLSCFFYSLTVISGSLNLFQQTIMLCSFVFTQPAYDASHLYRSNNSYSTFVKRIIIYACRHKQ